MLIIENGSGIVGANSYIGLAYAQSYLSDRGRLTTSLWDTKSVAEKESALIAATDYIDKRFGLKFLGQPLFLNIPIHASNLLIVNTLPSDGETITFNETVYTFRTVSSLSSEIQIGANVTAMAAAIALAAGSQPDMTFTSTDSVVKMTSVEEGDIKYPTNSTSPGISFESETLTGGTLEGGQSLCFPRDLFSGIPEVLRMATVEYAVRALSDTLMPDPVVESSGQQVRRRFEKVGPIEEETVYQSQTSQIFKTYPEADYLMKTLISPNSGVYR